MTNNNTTNNTTTNKTTNAHVIRKNEIGYNQPNEKQESKNKIENKMENKTKDSYNTQSDARMKEFIPYSVNPDNNAFFAKYSNHLSSKGD
ncbi:hypothetical protein [Anaerosporobacter faecicola]|uniref:hypothetical protein n=1 Tax=Anaerosporobacter faecicola TaxID=2718714 RepID=UPI00143B2B23|nr:hypothetical protein [Anaerosporobacter faecicola]